MTIPSQLPSLSRTCRRKSSTLSKILLVEDDPDTSMALQIRLAASGFEVTTLANGKGAVGMAQKLQPDLMCLDLGLPGIDGFEVLAQLQLVRPETPVIVMSCWQREQCERRALDAGAHQFLQKPISDVDLLDAISLLLED